MCVVGHGYLLPLAAHRLCCCDHPHTPAVTVGLCSKHADRWRNLAKCSCGGSRHWLAWGDPNLDQLLCAEPSIVTAAQRARRCRVLGASIVHHLPGSQLMCAHASCAPSIHHFSVDSAKKGTEVRFCLESGCQGRSKEKDSEVSTSSPLRRASVVAVLLCVRSLPGCKPRLPRRYRSTRVGQPTYIATSQCLDTCAQENVNTRTCVSVCVCVPLVLPAPP